VDYFINESAKEMRREFTVDGWKIRPVQDGDIDREKRRIFRDGRWFEIPRDGEVRFTGEAKRHAEFLVRGGVFSIHEFSTWEGDLDGHYRPATIEEAQRFCEERSVLIGKPVKLAEAEE